MNTQPAEPQGMVFSSTLLVPCRSVCFVIVSLLPLLLALARSVKVKRHPWTRRGSRALFWREMFLYRDQSTSIWQSKRRAMPRGKVGSLRVPPRIERPRTGATTEHQRNNYLIVYVYYYYVWQS
eukprot:scaffold1814_cov163-Amphora_coffeaeformis.AAC.2